MRQEVELHLTVVLPPPPINHVNVHLAMHLARREIVHDVNGRPHKLHKPDARQVNTTQVPEGIHRRTNVRLKINYALRLPQLRHNRAVHATHNRRGKHLLHRQRELRRHRLPLLQLLLAPPELLPSRQRLPSTRRVLEVFHMLTRELPPRSRRRINAVLVVPVPPIKHHLPVQRRRPICIELTGKLHELVEHSKAPASMRALNEHLPAHRHRVNRTTLDFLRPNRVSQTLRTKL